MSLGRHILLAEQQPTFDQTGIDFIAVERTNHARVYVYFVIDPANPDLAFAPGDFDVQCEGVQTRRVQTLTAQAFDTHTDAQGRNRTVLMLDFENGDTWETQRLTLSDLMGARLDPFSSSALFSFKQACPTVFDCACYGAPEEVPKHDYPVDYLARDFESYLEAFATFSTERYPDWEMNIAADQAAMQGELIAGLGDELAWIQDSYKFETEFEHLKERRSFEMLTRILGYRLQPELPATGFAVLRHYDGNAQPSALAPNLVHVLAGTGLTGLGDDDRIIPFEIGESLADIRANVTYPTNSVWTDLPVHVPDETCPWIVKGGRQIFVTGTALADPAIGPGTRLLIENRPADQGEALRRLFVVLDEDPEVVFDELVGTNTTRLHWREEDALPFPLKIDRAFVSGNVVPVMSGQVKIQRATIGPNDLENVDEAIEREGPGAKGDPERPVIYRLAMPATVTDGLSWRTSEGDTPWDRRYDAEVALTRTDELGVPLEDWAIVGDMLTQTATDEAAKIEAGHWGPTFTYVENNTRKSHMDFIGDPGVCLRFGGGGFGMTPADGSFFELAYRTAWAKDANLPMDRLALVVDPVKQTPDGPFMPNEIRSAWNPIAFDNAKVPENLALAKQTLPHFHKGHKLRAVRNKDFHELLSARKDIDAVIAKSFWLGTWPGTFIAADPRNSLAFDEDQEAEVRRYIEEIRLVGRPAYLTDAALRPIDLQIVICHDPRTPFGHVVEAILHDLAGDHSKAFFHPNNLSFGSQLFRAALEARIAAQTGVRSILRLRYRWRGELDFQDFTQSALESAHDQIPVLKNDPMRPNLGRIEVFEGKLPEETAP